MQRRELLRLLMASGGLVGVLVAPAPAGALGGELPPIGDQAPNFELDGISPDRTGRPVATHLSLADLIGHWAVIYFYPKDFTSGCTLEARGFQRDLEQFEAADARVIGVSADSPDQHAEFCGSEGLRYTLLSDPGGGVSRRYGSWIAPFSQRHTFLIDPDGVLQARWTAVSPSRHSGEVLAELKRLQG